MKNIHVLKTDKPSKLYFNHNKEFEKYQFSKEPFINGLTNTTNQHIYITSSDEEIKDGDWWLNLKTNDIDKCTHKSEVLLYNSEKYKHIKKIILTTDQELIKDGVQAIDDEFLEFFVKNPSCEEVEIESKFDRVDGHYHDVWEIIIPKEEPKQHVELINDNIEEFDKAIKLFKQEPLEESAERISKTHSVYETGQDDFYQGFIAGAKWQQERMYSEEETIQLLIKFNQEIQEVEDVRIWFEQFKKK